MKIGYTARKKRRRTGGFIIVFIAVVALFGLVNTGRSLLKIYRLDKMKHEERSLRNNLSKQRDRLRLEIYRLSNDSLYIEGIARSEYGMIKKGEEVFNISAPDTTNGKKNVPAKRK